MVVLLRVERRKLTWKLLCAAAGQSQLLDELLTEAAAEALAQALCSLCRCQHVQSTHLCFPCCCLHCKAVARKLVYCAFVICEPAWECKPQGMIGSNANHRSKMGRGYVCIYCKAALRIHIVLRSQYPKDISSTQLTLSSNQSVKQDSCKTHRAHDNASNEPMSLYCRSQCPEDVSSIQLSLSSHQSGKRDSCKTHRVHDNALKEQMSILHADATQGGLQLTRGLHDGAVLQDSSSVFMSEGRRQQGLQVTPGTRGNSILSRRIQLMYD